MKKIFVLLIGLIFSGASFAQTKPPQETTLDRFLRYVKIDTQSAERQKTVPSTKKQFDLANLLADELKKLNVQNVRINEFAIVYGNVPGNLADNSKVPTVGFIAHMDTAPSASDANVNPVIHKNYQGGDIILPADKTQVITVAGNPDLKNLIGDDIITADGTTLLGSDDKAGIAEIMTMIDILRQNPQIKHGKIAVAFTPDEEVGGGIEKFDVEGFGAKFAYTVDGEELGKIDNETWSSRIVTVTFHGKAAYPSAAKGIMVNSVYAAADFLTRFPQDMLPETSEGRVGFIHPIATKLDTEDSTVRILLRDFEMSGLDAKEVVLKKIMSETQAKYPAVKIAMNVKAGETNMNEVLKNYPQLTDYAIEAAKRAGIAAKLNAIRGGTDGSDLTFRNLPTPNLFTGGHNFHGKLEFNSRGGLEKTTATLVNLVQIYAEKFFL